MESKKVYFQNNLGYILSAKLEFPMLPKPLGYAIFAHVFTGNKNLIAAKHISRALRLEGFAVLRFDFTGLGESEGDFADTNFTSNVDDLVAAADYLEEHYEAPRLIVGHSLGGAASIFAAKKIDSIQAIATIGAPSEPEHVTHLLSDKMSEIENEGKAIIELDGRTFTIKKQFLDDIKQHKLPVVLEDMDKSILVLHSPQDRVVEIENAAAIYHAAKHPKSFVTLNHANHMLTNKDDAYYAGTVIASWAKRYVDIPPKEKLRTDRMVVAKLAKNSFTTEIMAGRHGMTVDESEALGGNDFGPSPYQMLATSLASCICLTIQTYASQYSIQLDNVLCHVAFNNRYSQDRLQVDNPTHVLGGMECVLECSNELDEADQQACLQIASKSPMYKVLSKNMNILLQLKS